MVLDRRVNPGAVFSDLGDQEFTEDAMKGIRLSTNFAVFVLFFGVATLEAFQTRNWLKAAFWLAIGLAFLLADNRRKGHVLDR